MSSSSNAKNEEASPLSFRLRNIRKWQLSLILLSAAVLALILLAILVIPTVRIITGRVGEHTEAMQNPTIRAEFVPTSSKLVQDNRGLREAMSCADKNYEILANSKGYGTPADPGCDMKISWFDFEMIKREMPHSLYRANFFSIEHDGKYYSMVMLYA